MTTNTISSQDFARDVPAAKRAAMTGPVFITENGCDAFVLLNIADYHRITERATRSLLNLMDGIPGGDNIDFDPPRLQIQLRPVAFD
jgi:PHD/YefM family antitoxin component YafN of YafNO toxin-antitoxin module